MERKTDSLKKDYLKKKTKEKVDKKFFFLSKKVGEALVDYNMLQDKDRVAVAVSGGKDSTGLLKLLEYRRKVIPFKFEILAIHIDLGFDRNFEKGLKKFFKDSDFDYVIKKVDLSKNQDKKKGMNCFWCSWNRRKALFDLVRKHKCTKLALGHHKDDIIETTLLNLFFQANISTMKPYQELFEGEMKIIRPLAYVYEKEMKELSKYLKLKTISCMCPHADNNRRRKVRAVVEDMKKICPAVKNNIYNALKNIRHDYLP